MTIQATKIHIEDKQVTPQTLKFARNAYGMVVVNTYHPDNAFADRVADCVITYIGGGQSVLQALQGMYNMEKEDWAKVQEYTNE